MYAFISGKIEYKTENTIVLNCNGVGYEIFATSYAINNAGNIGDLATIQTYLHVREDAMTLFGFSSNQEKEVFLKLITVSGVGAKTAISILSGISYNDLISCIISEDIKSIGSIKGIGKKTAERIVLELKNNFQDLEINSLFSNNQTLLKGNENLDEATMLLVNMGLSKFDALKLVKDVAAPNDTTEDIIKKALKNMR